MKYLSKITYRPQMQAGRIMWVWEATILEDESGRFVKKLEGEYAFTSKDATRRTARGLVKEYIEAISEDNEEMYSVNTEE